MSTELLHCYNKGCGQKYNERENTETSCKHHPGGPVFHDALKGWSCCKRRTTDFTEFLNIPGCATGRHSNVKPEPPAVEKSADVEIEVPKVIKPPVAMERPSKNEPFVQLQTTIADSLKQVSNDQSKESSDVISKQSGVVVKGTNCKNNGCTVTYMDEGTDEQVCIYHPGVPVFHEGMKYWSCCEQKTTDFNNFLSQGGCATGKHLWIKQEEESKSTQTACRFDWHQTSSFVTITIFSKQPTPQSTSITANKVCLKVHITFENGKKVFKHEFSLKGIVDPSRSNVKLLGSKVEVNLRKMEAGSWNSLTT